MATPERESVGDAGRQSDEETPRTTVSAPTQPTLRGAGNLVGLAGHDGTGDAGVFVLEDGSQVLRLENFEIEYDPDLRLYLVPGADQTDPTQDALYLGGCEATSATRPMNCPPTSRWPRASGRCWSGARRSASSSSPPPSPWLERAGGRWSAPGADQRRRRSSEPPWVR